MITNKIKIIFTLLFMLTSIICFAQNPKQDSVKTAKKESEKKTVTIYGGVNIPTIYVRSKRRKGIYRDGGRLEQIIKKVYPIAIDGNNTLIAIEKELLTYKTEKEQKAYIKRMEKALLQKYKPVLKTLTTSEALILLKLVDRQTGDTSFDLVKELRGGFSAFFWQGIGRLFSVNLKSQYDANGDDQIIEYYIQKYEQENNL